MPQRRAKPGTLRRSLWVCVPLACPLKSVPILSGRERRLLSRGRLTDGGNATWFEGTQRRSDRRNPIRHFRNFSVVVFEPRRVGGDDDLDRFLARAAAL